MKALWRLLIAVTVLAVVAAVLFWPGKKTQPASTRPLLTFATGQAEKLQISRPGQPDVLAVRQQNAWQLQQPYAVAADPAVIKGILGTLNDITGARKLGHEANLAGFGLDQPSTVRVSLQGGKSLDFAFGGTAPTSDNVYMKTSGDAGVFLVPGYVRDDVIKSAFALQDKSLLHFSESAVTGLVLHDRGKVITLKTTKGKWPKNQQSNVQTLLDALHDGEMDSVADPQGQNPARYGLAHPALSLQVEWKAGHATLDLGTKRGAAEFFARNSSSPAIFVLSSYIVDDLNALMAPKPKR